MGKMDSEHPSLFAGTSACILKRSVLVPTALVFSFGVRNVFWSVCFGCMRTWLDEMDGSTIAGPHGQDGLEAQSLFAGTSACILKRSGLVPTALVFSFGVRNGFWSILVAWGAHGWMKWTALLLQFLMGKMDWKLSPCLRVLRHVY